MVHGSIYGGDKKSIFLTAYRHKNATLRAVARHHFFSNDTVTIWRNRTRIVFNLFFIDLVH